jgi:lysophospholipase L1-like esterase
MKSFVGHVLFLAAYLVGTAPAPAAPYTIVAFGDSTTAPRGALHVYADLLRDDLPARGMPIKVINAGVGGATTDQARARLDRDVLAHKPHLVIVQFGINDASADVWKNPPVTQPRVGRDRYEANLREIVRAARKKGAAVLLLTPNPMRWTDPLRKLYGKPPYKVNDPDGFNVLLAEYAASVRLVARQEKVPLVDVYAAFQMHGKTEGQSVDDLLLDGMHPNDRGQRLVADLLLGAIDDLRSTGPLAVRKILLIGQGPDGHPATTHEYLAGLKVLSKCLEPVPGVEVSVVRADGPWKEGPDLIGQADGVVLFLAEGARWGEQDPKRYQALTRLAARRGGLVVLHWAMGTREAGPIDGCLQLFGGCHGGPDRKYRVLDAEVQVVEPPHPIAAGIGNFRVHDEFYYRLKFVKPQGEVRPIRPILRVPIDGKMETVAWAWEHPAKKGRGARAFGFSGLHFHDNWRLPAYRRLVTQGVLWTVDLPIPPDGLPVDVPEADLKLK